MAHLHLLRDSRRRCAASSPTSARSTRPRTTSRTRTPRATRARRPSSAPPTRPHPGGRRASRAPAPPASAPAWTSTGYRRIRDQFLDLQYRAQAMQVGEQRDDVAPARPGRARARRAERERHLEPDSPSSGTPGPTSSNSPERPGRAPGAVDQAKNLAAAFRSLDDQLTAVKAQTAGEYASLTDAGGDVDG